MGKNTVQYLYTFSFNITPNMDVDDNKKYIYIFVFTAEAGLLVGTALRHENFGKQ